uniref:Methyltransferase-like protein 25 n=2 Tax=Schistocephalus solidus TaxID=70667 RepID=A0A0X3P062_SCHSO
MSRWLRSEYPWLRLGRNARTVASQPLERLASLGNLLRAGEDPASISDLQAALNECFPRTTYYRVMLQQLLLDHLPPEQHRPTEWIVGRRNHQRRKLVQIPPGVGGGSGGGGGGGDPTSSSILLVNVGPGPRTKGSVDEIQDSRESFVSYTRWSLQRLGLEELSNSLTDDFIAAYPTIFPGLESRIHCHYMMRCCFGPVVEACILLDRVLFLFEAGREHSLAVTPRLVRVFDPLISPRCHAIVATK